MSLQKIINISETLTIDRRKLTSVQYTRSEIAKVNETTSRNPWRLTLGISAIIPYELGRDVIETIDTLDRTKSEIVSFATSTGASSGLSYMFAYQGAMSSGQITSITVQSFTGNKLTLTGLPSVPTIGANGVLFKKGDFVQIKDYPYPFTVTEDVVRGTNTATNAVVTATMHRPNFISASVVSKGINVGNNVQFRVFCPNMPTYKLSPGGRTALISFNGDFQLVEYTGDVL